MHVLMDTSGKALQRTTSKPSVNRPLPLDRKNHHFSRTVEITGIIGPVKATLEVNLAELADYN